MCVPVSKREIVIVRDYGREKRDRERRVIEREGEEERL